MNVELKSAINQHLPFIDGLLANRHVPVFERYMRAASIFVNSFFEFSSINAKAEFLKSIIYIEEILPIVNDWYWDRYGELARHPKRNPYSGLLTLYGQPIRVKIPANTIRIEVPDESAWFTYPDHLLDSESIATMIEPKVDLEKLDRRVKDNLITQAGLIVSWTRKINLYINMASRLDDESRNMANGIWPHFEQAISNILSFKSELASTACWELHIAIEKSLKVLIKDKCNEKASGHCLNTLSNKAKLYVSGLNTDLVRKFPSAKDAIKSRYAEMPISTYKALEYYKIALEQVRDITKWLERDLIIDNGSILLKKHPLAR